MRPEYGSDAMPTTVTCAACARRVPLGEAILVRSAWCEENEYYHGGCFEALRRTGKIRIGNLGRKSP